MMRAYRPFANVCGIQPIAKATAQVVAPEELVIAIWVMREMSGSERVAEVKIDDVDVELASHRLDHEARYRGGEQKHLHHIVFLQARPCPSLMNAYAVIVQSSKNSI
jgi:hypothetical protein